jgi:hypothetical protein
MVCPFMLEPKGKDILKMLVEKGPPLTLNRNVTATLHMNERRELF